MAGYTAGRLYGAATITSMVGAFCTVWQLEDIGYYTVIRSGIAPLTLEGLEPGDYKATCSPASGQDYTPNSVTFVVKDGETTNVNVPLTPTTGLFVGNITSTGNSTEYLSYSIAQDFGGGNENVLIRTSARVNTTIRYTFDGGSYVLRGSTPSKVLPVMGFVIINGQTKTLNIDASPPLQVPAVLSQGSGLSYGRFHEQVGYLTVNNPGKTFLLTEVWAKLTIPNGGSIPSTDGNGIIRQYSYDTWHVSVAGMVISGSSVPRANNATSIISSGIRPASSPFGRYFHGSQFDVIYDLYPSWAVVNYNAIPVEIQLELRGYYV